MGRKAGSHVTPGCTHTPRPVEALESKEHEGRWLCRRDVRQRPRAAAEQTRWAERSPGPRVPGLSRAAESGRSGPARRQMARPSANGRLGGALAEKHAKAWLGLCLNSRDLRVDFPDARRRPPTHTANGRPRHHGQDPNRNLCVGETSVLRHKEDFIQGQSSSNRSHSAPMSSRQFPLKFQVGVRTRSDLVGVKDLAREAEREGTQRFLRTSPSRVRRKPRSSAWKRPLSPDRCPQTFSLREPRSKPKARGVKTTPGCSDPEETQGLSGTGNSRSYRGRFLHLRIPISILIP